MESPGHAAGLSQGAQCGPTSP